MGYFIKKALEKVQRPSREREWYKRFYRQKSLNKMLDDKAIKNWPDERLAKEKIKVQNLLKKIQRLEKKQDKKIDKRSIIASILALMILASAQLQLYWVGKLMIVVVTEVSIAESLILSNLNKRAKKVLSINEETIRLEMNRRILADADYSHVESIDSPELCAIMVKRCKPIIMKVDEENGRIIYNVLLYGQIYRLEMKERMEKKIKITN